MRHIAGQLFRLFYFWLSIVRHVSEKFVVSQIYIWKPGKANFESINFAIKVKYEGNFFMETVMGTVR